jgi:hypothetical protein
MLRFFARLLVALGIIAVVGCGGGGGCGGCGMQPLPNGFALDRRIENAASVRLTDTGIGFLEQNLGTLAGLVTGGGGSSMGGVFMQGIGEQKGKVDLFLAKINYTVCPGGPDLGASPPKCGIEIDFQNAKLDISSIDPHHIAVVGPLPVRLQNLPVETDLGDVTVVLNGNGACPNAAQTFANIGLRLELSVEMNSLADQGVPDDKNARYGYSRAVATKLELDKADLENALKFCGGLQAELLNALKGIISGFLFDSLLGNMTDMVNDQLCQSADPMLDPPCPPGTQDVSGVCRYGSDGNAPCLPTLLGMEGKLDLGVLLGGFSPGASGQVDLVVAAGGHSLRADMSGYHYGDLNPIGQGATLSLYGGADPAPQSACVPRADLPLPNGIPVPDELTANTVPGWPMATPGPHVGFALSERYTNWLLAQIYNSGALCLGISPSALAAGVDLTTALLSIGLGATSLEEMGLQKQPAAVALMLRPQKPPTVKFGNGTDAEKDPLLLVSLPQVSFDFYSWTFDRFVRFMIATMDVTVPMNLVVTAAGLQPVIASVGLKNVVVTGTDHTVREDPAPIAALIESLVGSLVGPALGMALPPFDINQQLAALGLKLVIPESVEGKGSPGLRKLTKDTDAFLGLFAALEVAQAPMMAKLAPEIQTTAEIVEIERIEAAPVGDDLRPLPTRRVRARLGSSLDAVETVEYQWRVNRGPWRPFVRERDVWIEDPWLRWPGKHRIEVRARVVGDPLELDPAPAELVVLVDQAPPRCALREGSDGTVRLDAWDDVSGSGELRARVRFGRSERGALAWAAWSEWMPLGELGPLAPGDAELVEAEVVDEDENVGTTSLALLRGRAAAGGCQCVLEAPRRHGSAAPFALAALVLAIALARRRRTRGTGRSRGGFASSMGALALVLTAGASGCSCSEEENVVAPPEPGCRGRGDCLVLRPAIIGAYTSAAAAPDGTLWLAGYLEAQEEWQNPWGDLVVGAYDGEAVDWRAVDGVPAEPEVDIEKYDPKGFRGGQLEPGDDVGLWTSIAIDPAGSPAVAYYDATNRALRYAHLAGGGWVTTTVQQAEDSDLGRYAKLRFVGASPVIAYLAIEPGSGGAARSGVRLATGSGADGGSWSFEDVAFEAASPCTSFVCASGELCVASTSKCAAKADCPMDCPTGEACVAAEGGPKCEVVRTSEDGATYPDAYGLYIASALRPGGELALAFYDRIHGNAVVATRAAGGWTTAIVDGQEGMEDTGDRGIGLSLFVDDQDDFHLSYVDGLSEGLLYLLVQGGSMPGEPEVIDDGLLLDGVPSTDGLHLVGDDSNLLVTPGGEVRVSYQDATAGKLRLAVGTPAGGAHAWKVQVVEQEGLGGFFSQQIEHAGALKIASFWRSATPATRGNVDVLAP